MVVAGSDLLNRDVIFVEVLKLDGLLDYLREIADLACSVEAYSVDRVAL